MNKIKYLMVLFLVLFVGNTNAEECSSTPADGCEVSENTTFNLDTYNLPNGIRFNTSNIFLDCNGATVIGNYTGYGITSGNFNNIQIHCVAIFRGYIEIPFKAKFYKPSFSVYYGMLPSDPTGSLDDCFYRYIWVWKKH